METAWWWRMIWQLKCPLKSKIFCWFLFSGKALTWDILRKKGWEGPGHCYLCKLVAETNFHLGVDYPFTKSVWREIESKLKIKKLWFGDSILSCMKNWCFNDKVKQIRSLPAIVTWFIWKARNHRCFDDFTPSPAQVSASNLGLLYSYP